MKIDNVDLVFLLDLSGGMSGCIDSVKDGIRTILNEIDLDLKRRNEEFGTVERSYPLWRFKVCGYRNHALNSENWFVENPFVYDLVAAEAQLTEQKMQTAGGDEEEAGSLLDALFRIAKLEQTEKGLPECSSKWRPRGTCHHVVVWVTNTTFNNPMTIPEASGGEIGDVITALMGARIIMNGFCPEWDGYYELACVDRAETEFVAFLSDTPALAGFGKESEWRKAKQITTEAILKIDMEKYRKMARDIITWNSKFDFKEVEVGALDS
jgi:hypothetical protein